MKRKQKKFEGQINPDFPSKGWDPLGDAMRCVTTMKTSIDRCNSGDIIAGAACAFGNAEAAFYEKQANEEEMQSIKDDVVDLRSEFTKKCKCINR